MVTKRTFILFSNGNCEGGGMTGDIREAKAKQAAQSLRTLDYMSGFGNSFETEALPGALPVGQNNPQQPPYGLYAEQISGSAFTAPRARNQRSWLYRIHPVVRHSGDYRIIESGNLRTAPLAANEGGRPLGQLRWNPLDIPTGEVNFLSGLHTITVAGDAEMQTGMAAHVALVTTSMKNEYFFNADGEMLIVPQSGSLRLRTELGILDVEPAEICVIPRGVIFQVQLLDGPARAYVCENYGSPFTLPERGPIGANCLANSRDFLSPVASYEDLDSPGVLYAKWGGALHACDIGRSPFDVVAWHGNYAPYKYDLRRFSPIGTVLFDHADPSIYTVLTSPSEIPGTANVDFVTLADRWVVGENTFRPPWYHRNFMSELMGLVSGIYDAREEGFLPGGLSLHNQMLPHGPDADVFERASSGPQQPVKIDSHIAFMIETRYAQKLTKFAAETSALQTDYQSVWRSLKTNFSSGKS